MFGHTTIGSAGMAVPWAAETTLNRKNPHMSTNESLMESLATEAALDKVRASWNYRISRGNGVVVWSNESVRIPVTIESKEVPVTDLRSPSVDGVAVVNRKFADLEFDAAKLGSLLRGHVAP